MKKTFLYLFALMCVTVSLTACGSDDEPEVNIDAVANYQIDFSDDLIEVADVAVVFITNNGQVKIESLQPGKKQWTHTATVQLNNKRRSVDFGYKVVLTYKGGEATKESYNLKAEGKITSSVPGSSRTIEEKLFDATVKANKLEQTVIGLNNKALGVTVDKDGNINKNAGFTVSI